MVNKKAISGMSLIVALVIGIMYLLIYFNYIFPRIEGSMNVFMLIGTGCKYPGFYHDVISNNEDYAYQFYQEYINCNYEETEDDAYIYAWKKLGLKDYGLLNLIKSYTNSGNLGRLNEKIGKNSFLDYARQNARTAYLQRNLDRIDNVLVNFKWRIDSQIDCDGNQNIFLEGNDPNFLGIKQSHVITACLQDNEDIDKVNRISFNSNPTKNNPSFYEELESGDLLLKYYGFESKTIFFQIELNDNVFIG